jgi:GNAT superfamily N-acetyltransferase
MSTFAKRIEEVSLNSWPTLQNIIYDGWVLRFSRGYTKRANSVNPIYPSTIDLPRKVARCERIYSQKGLLPVFRMTPFASPSNLDQYLSRRKYKIIDRTIVLYLDLRMPDDRLDTALKINPEKLDRWLDIFHRFGGSPVGGQGIHREILQAIPSKRILAALKYSNETVACGLGVLEGDFLGLFDLITAPEMRRMGFGTGLVSGLLDWAREYGALHAYLQVEKRNALGITLYTRLGFQEIYQYWYRVPEDLVG